MKFPFFKRKPIEQLTTVSFYNLENLFDTIDDPETLDDDFTPKGEKKWTPRRYQKKVNKLANTIAQIGEVETKKGPVLIGVAEVENELVLQDLLKADALDGQPYHYVHYDSPDERGIDTALLYNEEHFSVLYSEPIPLKVYNEDGVIDRTRDILYVKGMLNGELTHVFVNHWPSRRQGNAETEYKRVEAANTVLKRMKEISQEEHYPNYIIMGDFNDDPASLSIQTLLGSGQLHHPFLKIKTLDRGSTTYQRQWNLFDQILISHSFLNYEKGTHSFQEANIFDESFLTQFKGKYKGSPHRTYVGKRYFGGFSDHFPVYLILKKN